MPESNVSVMAHRISFALGSSKNPRDGYVAIKHLIEEAKDSGDFEGEQYAREQVPQLYANKVIEYPDIQHSRAYEEMYSGKNRVVIFKEKNGVACWNIATPDDFALTFISVVKERLDPDYCFYPDHSSYDLDLVEAHAVQDLYIETKMTPAVAAEFVARILAITGVNAQVRHIGKSDPTVQLLGEAGISDSIYLRHLDIWKDNADMVAMFCARLVPNLHLTANLIPVLDAHKDHRVCRLLRRLIEPSAIEQARALVAGVPKFGLRRTGRMAYAFLSGRKGHEYEGFSIQPVNQGRMADLLEVA